MFTATSYSEFRELEVGAFDTSSGSFRSLIERSGEKCGGRLLAAGRSTLLFVRPCADAIEVLEPKSGSLLATWPETKVTAVTITSDGAMAAVGDADGRVRVVAVPSGRILRALSRPAEANARSPASVSRAFFHSGRVVAGYSDGAVWTEDLATGAAVELARPADRRELVGVNAQGAPVMALARDDALVLTSGAREARFSPSPLHPWRIEAAEATQDGALVAVRGRRSVEVHRLDDGKSVLELRSPASPVSAGVGRVADGAMLLAAAWNDGEFRAWNVTEGRPLQVRDPPESPITALAFADEGTLAVLSEDGTVRVYRRRGAVLEGTKLALAGKATRMAISSDGAHVAAVLGGGGVELVDTRTNRRRRLATGSAEVSDVGFEAGVVWAAANTDEALEWDARSGRPLGRSRELIGLLNTEDQELNSEGPDRSVRVVCVLGGCYLLARHDDTSVDEVLLARFGAGPRAGSAYVLAAGRVDPMQTDVHPFVVCRTGSRVEPFARCARERSTSGLLGEVLRDGARESAPR